MWTLAFGQHEDRWLTHGYEATREAAVDAGKWSTAPRSLSHMARAAWLQA
jgi:hypothetical protein